MKTSLPLAAALAAALCLTLATSCKKEQPPAPAEFEVKLRGHVSDMRHPDRPLAGLKVTAQDASYSWDIFGGVSKPVGTETVGYTDNNGNYALDVPHQTKYTLWVNIDASAEGYGSHHKGYNPNQEQLTVNHAARPFGNFRVQLKSPAAYRHITIDGRSLAGSNFDLQIPSFGYSPYTIPADTPYLVKVKTMDNAHNVIQDFSIPINVRRKDDTLLHINLQ